MGARTRGYSRGATRRSGLGASAATGAETPEYYDYNFYGHWGGFLFYFYSYYCCYIWHYDGERWDNAVLLGSSVHPTCNAALNVRGIFGVFMKSGNFIIVASNDDYLWGSEVVDFQETLTLIGGADAE